MDVDRVVQDIGVGHPIDLSKEAFGADLCRELVEVRQRLVAPLVNSLEIYLRSMEGMAFRDVAEMREFASNVSGLLRAFDLKLVIPHGPHRGAPAGLGVAYSPGYAAKHVFVFRTNDQRATHATDRCPRLILCQKPPESRRGPKPRS